MRIKLLVDHLQQKAGDVVRTSQKEARELINKGKAIISKDMSKKDIKKK